MYQIKSSLCDVGDISFINASPEYNVTPSKIQSLVFKLIFSQDWINLKFNLKRSANQSSESSIKCKSPVLGIIENKFFLAGITRSRSLESNQRYLVQQRKNEPYPGSSIKSFRQIIKPRKIRRNQFTLQLNEKSDQDSNFGPIQRQVRPKLKKLGHIICSVIYG